MRSLTVLAGPISPCRCFGFRICAASRRGSAMRPSGNSSIVQVLRGGAGRKLQAGNGALNAPARKAREASR